MVDGERILEVPDGNQEADELPQRDHESDGQRGTFGRKTVDGSNTEVPERSMYEMVARRTPMNLDLLRYIADEQVDP